MTYHFHPEAKSELTEAIKYYNECERGLGYIFMQEIETTIERIIKYPRAWTTLSKNTRRCLTRRFPYGVIYQEVDNDIIIISIMHLSRKPGYWKGRYASFIKDKSGSF